MAKLEGIIYNTFNGYVVLRGFAPIGELAEISKRPNSYQREADDQHKIDIVRYLAGTKSYFPEITLACRVPDYEGLIQSIGTDKDISKEESSFVKGLYVLSERLPIGRDRARHAYLELKKPTEDEKLVRVDGNHRLEPLSSNLKWWHKLIVNRETIKEETDPIKIEGWLDHEASMLRDEIAKKIVPFTIIMSEENDAANFEAKIFHDINFKALPLREEASLKIISELNAFEVDKLGAEYELALQLIKEAKSNQFSAIHWLQSGFRDENSYYRTACLRISQLLYYQRNRISELLKEAEQESETTQNELKSQDALLKEIDIKVEEKKKEIVHLEIETQEFSKSTLYKSLLLENEELKANQNLERNKSDMLYHKLEHLQYTIRSLKSYVDKCTDKNAILSTLMELVNVYNELDNDYGNIAYLCALVHYSLLENEQLDSFINWSKQNGITKITEPDDLSKDASLRLITMFDQIHQAKKNEIFISMQFGDSQSELIFEKITRAIEKFNSLHKNINLSVKPIRIDRNVESNTFSIPDKIREAIKSCGLIIADLSSANINVYHEIGYAMGVAESHNLIPNIILLYKENTDHNTEKKDVDKFVGFNLRNLSQLRFKEYDQLVNGLVERLEKHYGV